MDQLTPDDLVNLASLESKLDHVGDLVTGVAKDYHTGLFLHGEGGTGKSFKVLEKLKELKSSYVFHNSRLTARGLVDALNRAPTDIHLIEDAETLLDDKKSFGVLRSALWSQSRKRPMEREISWQAFNTDIRFVFTGGIIVISNANLAETIPEIRAIKTRINVLRLDLTSEELLAKMKQICLAGYEHGEDYLAPVECLQVRAYIVSELSRLNRPVDLRLLINGFRDFLQWKCGDSTKTWQELLQGRIMERPTVERRVDKKAAESTIALEINAKKIPAKDKVAEWIERTGLKERSFYRALTRVEKTR
ncbi:MAG: hypothetical protein WCL32_16205 [Planctomycetota bacterium]